MNMNVGKPRFVVIMFGKATTINLTKDPCSYAYYLSRDNGWSTAYAYFADEPIKNTGFEKYCELIYLGNDEKYDAQVSRAEKYCFEYASSINVIMLFNYGHSTYQIAKIAKKKNRTIKIYSKLDMNETGFAHFYDGTLTRRIKSSIEIWKSRNIDLFTVENHSFYNKLKKLRVFRNRIQYLPNCVSMMNVDKTALDGVQKENILITVGRLGAWQKNNELLIDALEYIPDTVLIKWKIYMVGSYTKELQEYIEEKVKKRPVLRKCIMLTGEIYDRQLLYTLYAKSRIFVLTSRHDSCESFGIVTVEAMYFGAYPILTEYGTIAYDIINNNTIGEVVPNYDSKKLAIAIQNRMQSRQIIEECENVKKYARARFDYEYWAKKLNIYLRGL